LRRHFRGFFPWTTQCHQQGGKLIVVHGVAGITSTGISPARQRRACATRSVQRTSYVVESAATIRMLSTPTREVGLLSSPLAL
jgi:hypothetical protein